MTVENRPIDKALWITMTSDDRIPSPTTTFSLPQSGIRRERFYLLYLSANQPAYCPPINSENESIPNLNLLHTKIAIISIDFNRIPFRLPLRHMLTVPVVSVGKEGEY